jgi:hypothetical protein
MQKQIIRVNNIQESIKENGLEYYVDRLVQDCLGDYYYVEADRYDTPEAHPGVGWELLSARVTVYSDDMIDSWEEERYFKYRILLVPRQVAHFVIDALRLQEQIYGIGSTEYDSPHRGKVRYYAKLDGRFSEIPKEVVIVESFD